MISRCFNIGFTILWVLLGCNSLHAQIGTNTDTYNVQWTNLVGVSQSGKTLVKSVANGWGNAGASSLNVLPANTDGWVEITTNTNSIAFGLSSTDVNANYTSINFAFMQANSYVYENGTVRYNAGATTSYWEVLRVERVAGTIYYKRNGTVIYTSAQTSTSSLVIDISMYVQGQTMPTVRCSFGAPSQLPNPVITYGSFWQNFTGTSVTGYYTLTSNAAAGWGNAGASTLNTLNPNTNGWIQFTMDNSGQQKAIGLSRIDADANYTSIDYAFVTNGSIVSVMQGGVSLSSFSASVGDVLRVERLGSSILFKKNGTVMYTIANGYMTVLIGDASLYDSGASFSNVQTSFWIPYAQGNVPDLIEFASLKDLYDSLHGSSWTTKTNWPTAGNWPSSATSAQMATWFGISVSGGDLVQLNLQSNALSGKIPNSIGNLTAVFQIQLFGNGLSGSIPAGLWNLTSLTLLNLSSNSLTGSIPSSIGSLKNLTNLQMQGNQLTGAIPASIGNLTNLSLLYLYSNQLSGSIPTEIGSLVNLTDVRLHINQLSGTIPASVGNLAKLNTFLCQSNQLTGNIPIEIGNLSNLANLQMANNRLTGSLPIEFGNLTNLYSLQVNNNQLSGAIPSSLGNLTKLQYLFLNSNKFSGTIPDMFGSLSSLIQLYIQYNSLSGPLPFSIGSLTNLQVLGVNGNQLSGELPSSLSSLTSLTSFVANNNQFTGGLPNVSGWTNITFIALQSNLLSGEVPSLGSCKKLSTLTLNDNRLTFVPTDILSLNALINLNLSSNLLTSIPNFANHVNKANLTLTINGNYLDYTQLEPLIGSGIKSLTYSTQNNINDFTSVNLALGSDLVLTARPKGAATSNITWQKLAADGVTWNDVTSANADPATGITYRVASATAAAEGKYRWYCTSTVATAFTLTSTAIEVKTPIRFTLDNLAFQYKYDGRNRLVAKRVPGADWVYMVYDQRDRLVMTQDGNLRAANQWLFTKYDALNRPVMTGIYTHTGYATQEQMSSQISTASFAETFSATSNHGYTNNVFPINNLDIRTVTYYDNYNYLSMWGSDNAYAYVPNQVDPVTVNSVTYSQPAAANTQVIGKVTGTKVRTSPNDPYWLQTATYYDDKYRVIQTVSDNNKGGIDITSSIYDFPGKVLATKTAHAISGLTWQNIVGAAVEGNTLKKTVSNNNWGTSGASSVQQLPAGSDGWMEVSVTELNTNKMIGFSDQDTDQNYTSIDYAFYLSSANLFVYINGVNKGNVGTLAMGDRLRLAREGGNMVFYRNNVKVYPTGATTLPCATVLMVDASLNSIGSTLGHARIGGVTSPQRTIARKLEYDHAQRPTKVWHSVNGSTPVLLVQNEYNEIGQLVDKKLHSTDGTSFKQSIDYRYNIRGWLTSINNSSLINDGGVTNNDNNDLFGVSVIYEGQDVSMNNTPRYNGGISSIKWSSNLGLGNVKERAYNFSFDPLNRLTSATHFERTSVWAQSNAYHEDNLSYDLNGNLLTLNRKSLNGALMDALSYAYKGNQLNTVTDTGDIQNGFIDGNKAGSDFSYNVDGDMTADKNKKITAIAYNHIHKPEKVTFSSGNYLQDVYDANGTKLSQQVYNASSVLQKKTDYIGDFHYENDTLKFVNHEEGRVVLTGATPEYVYDIQDPFKNANLSFTTKRYVDQPIATFETGNIVTEQSQFVRMDAARLINASIFDHTQNGVTNYSERLNGTSNEVNGVARSISVMPGDTIQMEVYAKYVDPSNSNNTSALNQFLAQIAAGTAGVGTVIDGANYAVNGNTTFPYAGLLSYPSGSSIAPKAYLNYLVFDRNYSFVTGGYVPVSTVAKEDGTNVQHEHLYQQIVIAQPGYVYIYLSNDNMVLGGPSMEVYFDDFKVRQIKSPIIQTDDYYPFGLRFNSYTRESTIPNKFLFHNKTEFVDDLGLNAYHFRYRMYDPAIGRFWSVDPLSEKYYYNSPYAFAENKLGMGIELEGLELAPWYNPPVRPSANQPVPLIAVSSTITTATQATTTTTSTLTGEVLSTKVVNRVYNVPGGSNIPSTIAVTDKDGKASNVSVSFNDTRTDNHGSNNKISTNAVNGYTSAIKIFAGMMKLNNVTITATTNGNHNTSLKPIPNWNNPRATSTHYPQNGGTGIDTGAINGVGIASLDSATLATWKVAMDSAGAVENLGPWTDKEHKDHFHNSFKKN